MGTLDIDRRSVLLAGACCLIAPSTQAQRLSERTITIVVPFTPGTGIDILARLLGEQIQKRWEQTVIIENKPGASGNIGSQQAARAEPDGHTLLMTVNTFVMNASLFKSLPYDPQKSFAPIIEVATGSLALVVHPSLAAATVSEFVAYAKARPDEINYASPGRGTPQHLAMELLKLSAGISLRHVPYSGSAGAVRDLVGGHVNAMFLPLHTALPLVADKQIRLLAVGSAARSAQAPDVHDARRAGRERLRCRSVVWPPGACRHQPGDRRALQWRAQRDPRAGLGARGVGQAGHGRKGGAPGASCGIDCQRSAALVQGGQGCGHNARVTKRAVTALPPR